MADDGGSSGRIRSAVNIAPPGDLRNVLIAMSDMPKFYADILQYRFDKSDGELAGHPLGNLIIAAVSPAEKGCPCILLIRRIFLPGKRH